MTGRHTRQPGLLSRLRAPLATTSDRDLPTLQAFANPLTAEHVNMWRNRVAGGLWLAVVDGSQRLGAPRRTQEQALEHLAPRVRVTKATNPLRSLVQRVRGIRFTRPTFTGSVLHRPSERTYRAAFSVLLGITLGYGYGAMTLEAPQDCATAFTAAEQVFITQENAGVSLVHRATRGKSDYDRYDAEVRASWKHEDELMGVYRDAKASCVGGAR